MVVARGWELDGEFSGYRILFCKIKNSVGGGGCTTVQTQLIPLKCILKNGYDGKFYVMWILAQLKNNFYKGLCFLAPFFFIVVKFI